MYRADLIFLCVLTCYTLFISPIQMWISSKADFVVTRSLRKLGNCTFALAGPAEWNKLPDFIRIYLQHYRSSKRTSRLICSRFIMTRLSCYVLLCKILFV